MTRTASIAALFITLALAACALPPPAVSALPAATALRGCPDWSRSSREDFKNHESSNFGCADAVNWHAQLADPSDAVRGRNNGAGDASGPAAAVERLRGGRVRLPPAADAPPVGTTRPGSGA